MELWLLTVADLMVYPGSEDSKYFSNKNLTQRKKCFITFRIFLQHHQQSRPWPAIYPANDDVSESDEWDAGILDDSAGKVEFNNDT